MSFFKEEEVGLSELIGFDAVLLCDGMLFVGDNVEAFFSKGDDVKVLLGIR